MKKKTTAIVIVLIACAALTVGAYPFIISRAKLELGGANPDEDVLGTVVDVSQRAMEQYCTGVVVTPMNTWLVGRREGAIDMGWAGDVPDLSATLHDTSTTAPSPPGDSFSGSQITFISRLNDNGIFELVATLPSAACLTSTPDGKRLLLLTGMDSPAPSAGYDLNQLVVLQSDDQAKPWQWRKEGFFPQAYVAWSMDPYFFDSQSVWVWSDDADKVNDAFETATITPAEFKTGLQYSGDGGATIEDIVMREPLLVDFESVRKRAPSNVEWSDANGQFGEIKEHVVQLDAQRAVVWLSQDFSYGEAGGRYITDHVRVTSFAPLNRKQGAWHADKVQRVEDFTIERVLDNHAGSIIAIANVGDEPSMRLFVLDQETIEWKESGRLPRAFGPIESWTGLREAFISDKVLVVNVMSSHEPPHWLAKLQGEEEISISADAVFFSTDWGHSWQRLAIPGYLGVLGIDAPNNKVLWAKGNWYDSTDLIVRSYGLL